MNGLAPYSNVLLIEDDPDDQEIFLSVLKEISSHLNCVTEFSALSALTKLRNHEINADLIFLDLNLPGMNGLEFLREAKMDLFLRKIPIIILSTTAQNSTKLTTLELGAKAFITKPNNYNDLIEILRYQLT